MGLVDKALWENRYSNPEAIEAELRGPKGHGWLMRWLLARAYDNVLFLNYSNGVGVDGNEIRTGALSLRKPMILDPYGRILAENWKAGNDRVVADLDRLELYTPLTIPMGTEQDTRTVRFDKKGV